MPINRNGGGRGRSSARGGGAAAQTVDANHHAMGLMAQSPLVLICLIIGLSIIIYVMTAVQIANTEGSALALLQSSVTVVPGQTPQQVQEMLNGQLSQDQGVATTIAICVQIALIMLSFPADSAMLAMSRRFNVEISPSLIEAAGKQDGVRVLLSRILIGGDVLTDFLAVVRGHVLYSGQGGWFHIMPQFNLGVVVVGIIYPAGVCYVTIFCLKYLFIFLEALIEKLTPGFMS